MAGPVASAPFSPSSSPGPVGLNYRPALTLLTSLFFMVGFITVLNDVLVPHLKAVFDLDYTRSMLIQFVWYFAYFVISLPSAKFLEKWGYKRAMVTGLLVMATGALSLIPSSQMVSFPLFLTSLFVLGSGVTLLQVAANPYVAVIGPPETAPARLNLVQALNSAGTMIAPVFGSMLILGRSTSGNSAGGVVALTEAQRLADAQSVQAPYIGIVLVLVLLAVIIGRFKLPALGAASQRASGAARRGHSLWRHRNLVFGVPAIFIYMIAEIGVGSLMISFISRPEIGDLTSKQAGFYLTLLWGGMMVGRFIGSAMMRYIKAETILAFVSICAFVLVMMAVFTTGHLAMWSLVLVGLFHSIMFPTIFTLGIRGLGPLTEEGSGLLIMAIAGGALATCQGWIADHYGLQISFLLPAACEAYTLFYALWGCQPGKAAADGEAPAAG